MAAIAVDIGTRQIWATSKFELVKFKKKIIGLIVLTFIIAFWQTFGMYFYSWQNYDQEIPMLNVVIQVLSNVKNIFVVIAAVLASGIIASDLDKKTTLAYPNVSKTRILIGRVVAIYAMLAIMITVYYATLIAYILFAYPIEIFPIAFFASWGYALLFAASVLSIIVLFSALLKRESTALILSLTILVIGIPLLSLIVSLEPLYDPSYLSNLLIVVFQMPLVRFVTAPTGITVNGVEQMTTRWITPTIPTGILFMVLITVTSLVCAYTIFNKKQI